MELPFYSKIEEKERWFKCKTIKNKKDFDEAYQELKGKNLIYRGVHSSKYKLYTSSQRFWLTQNYNEVDLNYNVFIKTLIDSCLSWGNGTVKKFFDYNDIKYNDFTVLSFLQHYGAPTPLLDWTKNLDCALYFGASKHETGQSECDNYFSLYFIDEDTVKDFSYHEKREVLKLIGSQSTNENSIIAKIITTDAEKFGSYEKYMVGGKVEVIQDSSEVSYKINSNLNIINQEGIFIINTYPDLPLEEALMYSLIERVINDFNQKNFDIKNFDKKNFDKKNFDKKRIDKIWNSNNKYNIAYDLGLIQCYNIHSTLKYYVLERLRNDSKINENYVFPDPKKIVNDCLLDFKKNLNNYVKF